MKFNEKLIELRKKAGLSQEELGYKLNVTRQTVSKWELAQTTPEMDKLVEMSKIFNVSVDELLNEREVSQNNEPIIENQPINERKPRSNNTILIIVGVFIIISIVMTVGVFSGFNKFANKIFGIFDKTIEQQDEIQDGVFDMFNNIVDEAENQMQQMDKEHNESDKEVQNGVFDMFNNIVDEAENQMEQMDKEFEINSFNNTLEMYSGKEMGNLVISAIDKIITSNKTQERKITIKYDGTETQDETEINKIKQKIDGFKNYNISYEYDADGFINKATIENM